MRKEDMGDGVIVESPWLSTKQAAVYCGMAERTFREQTDLHNVKFSGSIIKGRKFHVDDLDKLMRERCLVQSSDVGKQEGIEGVLRLE